MNADTSKRMATMPNRAAINDERITYFGQTDARNKKANFGIKAKDRTRHVYVIGKTGMGKSTLLENMAVQDIKNGEGMAFIDPHGKTADLLLEYVPAERVKDVVYFAPFDTDFPISFNVLESVDADKRHLVVSGLMSTFKKIWQDAWSARMEYILTNTLLALLEYPGATLLGVNRMLAEKDFRKDVIDHVTDISVKNFWVKEFANYTERMAAEAVPAIQNKIGQFTANALIRNMIGQSNSSFNIRELMDNRKILIINLSKGKIGESNANLLGGMLITKIYLAAMSRADMTERTLKTMPNFYLFVDEFQSFANESFADILSEARKYKLNLTIAHQYIEQMEEEVRAAVFGNVGTMIVFRVGAYDAEILEKEFAPTFTAEDIVNLGFTQIYLKLMIDGISSPPFSATSLPPIAQPETSLVPDVIASSRAQFAHTRAEVEATIIEWHKPIMKAPPAKVVSPVPASTSASLTSVPKAVAPSSSAVKSSYVPSSPSPTPASPRAVPVSPASAAPVAPRPPSKSSSPPPVQKAAPTPPPPRPAPVATPFKAAFENLDEERVSIPASPSLASSPPSSSSSKIIPRSASVPAAATAPTSTPPPRPVSLSALAPKSQSVQNTQKIPTPKNVADLKSALASIMSKGEKQSAGEKKEESAATQPSAPTLPPRPSQKEPSTTEVKEVPKEVLEKLLKLD
jgi:energy-coupling factor transporter ATP-binding protein EcfA2